MTARTASPARKPRAPAPAPLSTSTKDLLQRLDTVASRLADPANNLTENELMAEHVRCVLNADMQPVFTADVLKLAAIELMRKPVEE